MVPFIVTQSVQKKLRTQSSVIVGNYEFYYAVGLAAERMKLSVDGRTAKPAEMEAAVKEAVHAYPISEEEDRVQEKYLMYLIERYEVDEDYDEEMVKLFEQGLEEATLV